MKFGTTIRLLRSRSGKSQAEFADLLAITQSYLSQLENDHKDPSVSLLKRLSDATGVPEPVILLLSLSESDIPTNKRRAYNELKKPILDFMTEVFGLEE